MKKIRLLSLSTLILLSLAGCQKEEMIMPMHVTPVVGQRVENRDNRTNAEVYVLTQINHYGVKGTTDKSYDVSLSTNGKLVFTGITNTSVLGEVTMQVPTTTVRDIKMMLADVNLNALNHMTLVEPDHSYIKMVYQKNTMIKPFIFSSVDDHETELNVLVSTIEQKLEINDLINGKSSLVRRPIDHN